MTAKEIYNSAINHLGYTDSSKLQNRALTVINKIYYELFIIFRNGNEDFVPAKTLASEINLPEEVLLIVMPMGVAAGIALGEGDGELQQYFAAEYDRARKRYPRINTVKDVI